MNLFFDVETTGLPNQWLPANHETQPHLVQLACLLVDADGREQSVVSLLVHPAVPIPAEATRIHGITDALASRCGVDPFTAAAVFSFLLDAADTLVAHNIKFDAAVMRTALERAGLGAGSLLPERMACTMTAAAPIVNMPPTARMLAAGFRKPKPPKLSECVRYFFGEDLDGAHDALVDVRACARVHRHLQSLGAV